MMIDSIRTVNTNNVYLDFMKLKTRYVGCKQKPFASHEPAENLHCNILSLSNIETEQYTRFEVWGTHENPKIKTTKHILESFLEVLENAILGTLTFEEFLEISSQDYEDLVAKNYYKMCGRTLKKLRRVCDMDIYYLAEVIREHIQKF